MISAVSSATSNGKFIIHLLERRKSDMANHREILSRMVFSDAQRPNRNPRMPDQENDIQGAREMDRKGSNDDIEEGETARADLHKQLYENKGKLFKANKGIVRV